MKGARLLTNLSHRCLRTTTRTRQLSSGGGSGPVSHSGGSTTFATAATAVAEKANSSKDQPVYEVSLGDSLPGFSEPRFSSIPESQREDPYRSELTVLENGLRVASAPQFGEFCTIGVCIDAGCRYEAPYPSGISHFLEKLAYSGTLKYTDGTKLFNDLEGHGGICDCQSTKDTFIYASSCHISGLEPVLGALAEAAMRPLYLDEQVASANEVLKFDNEDMNRDINPERILTDWIHEAAFRDNTLGLPKYCPDKNIPLISRNMLFRFVKAHFRPERMVITGVGVEHEQLVSAAQRHFLDTIPIWESDPDLAALESPPADQSIAQYTGGIKKVEKDLSDVSLGPTKMPELTHFMLGLESVSYKDPDFVAYCVLNAMMGGGGSFSAGGPGKGMYTRLYTNVLNKHHWMYNATSYHHVYADTGIYCIHASAPPSHVMDLVSIIVQEFVNMTGSIDYEELNRAKTQLRSMLLMNLEQRPVMFEDVGRQVLGHGRRKSPLEYIEEIKKVSAEDIQRIAENLFKSKASVVAYGNLKKFPDYEKIDQALARKDVKLLKPSKIFSFGR